MKYTVASLPYLNAKPIVLMLLIGCACCLAAQGSKPVLVVTKDGFPAGHGSPEGAACDLARAFIRRDAGLFQDTCIHPFGGGEDRQRYEHFLAEMTKIIKAESKKTEPSKGGPKAITKVFAVRHLSHDGPASYGYATFGFKEVEFVDVEVQLQTGGQSVNRTMVIQDRNGKWYVHPIPTVSPLLSVGLNSESASTMEIGSVYNLKKA